MRARISVPVVAAALACGAVAQPSSGTDSVSVSQPVSIAYLSSDYRPMWVTRNLEKPVIDGGGGHVGLLQDFALDLATGEVRGAVISVYRQGREEFHIVPVRLLRHTDQGLLLEGSGARAIQSSVAPAAPSVREASRVIRMPVADAAGRDVGEVIEMVIDPDRQRVEHLLVRSVHPRVGLPADHTFAVPIATLGPLPATGRIALNVPQTHLASLVGTDGDDAPPDTLRYLGRVEIAAREAPTGVPSVPTAVGATR